MDMIKQKPQKMCVLKNLRNFINNCTRNAITKNKASCKYSENSVDSGLFYNNIVISHPPNPRHILYEMKGMQELVEKIS